MTPVRLPTRDPLPGDVLRLPDCRGGSVVTVTEHETGHVRYTVSHSPGHEYEAECTILGWRIGMRDAIVVRRAG